MKHTIEIHEKDFKSLYRHRLNVCTAQMEAWKIEGDSKPCYLWYINFHDIKHTEKLENKFRAFWAGRTRDHKMLEMYETLIESVKID